MNLLGHLSTDEQVIVADCAPNTMLEYDGGVFGHPYKR